MTRRFVIHPRADLDQLECFTYLALHNPGAARRVLDAVERMLPEIEANPERGNRYLHAQRQEEDLRYVDVPGFRKYVAFYRISPTDVEVVRIVYGSRDLESIFRVL